MASLVLQRLQRFLHGWMDVSCAHFRITFGTAVLHTNYVLTYKLLVIQILIFIHINCTYIHTDTNNKQVGSLH